MSEISKLYDEVMAGAVKKVAADVTQDQGPAFDASFFSKVAAGEEAEVAELNAFIEQARAEGYDDTAIEAAMTQAMDEVGYQEPETQPEPETDAFEQEKMSAYVEGANQAIIDVLDSDLAKTAGITIDDLKEYELGGHYGQGYGETRPLIEAAAVKIAEAKTAADAKAGVARRMLEFVKAKGAQGGQLLAGGKKMEIGPRAGQRAGNRALLANIFGTQGGGNRAEALKSLGARAVAAGAVGGAGVGAHQLLKKKD